MNTGKNPMAAQKSLQMALLASSALLASLAWPMLASAQVQKCVDPVSGKITFSDRGCATGEETTAVRIAPANSIDGAPYRQPPPQQDYYTGTAPQAELGRSGPRVTVVGANNDAERERKKLCKEASTPHKGAHGLTAAQRAHAAQLCAGINLPAPMPHAAPAAPAGITNCDAGGCWDTNGMRYNKGAGTTHFPANGGPACQLIDGQMICP